MAEVWFYHLEQASLEQVLPTLLQRALGRGWRAVVQAGSPERVAALDQHLWSYDEASFLPHGTRQDGEAERQPVYLTDGVENPNGAAIRFCLDGALATAALAADASYDRVVLLFDGRDDDAVVQARRQWSAVRADGHIVSYWQQSETGAWEKRG